MRVGCFVDSRFRLELFAASLKMDFGDEKKSKEDRTYSRRATWAGCLARDSDQALMLCNAALVRAEEV